MTFPVPPTYLVLSTKFVNVPITQFVSAPSGSWPATGLTVMHPKSELLIELCSLMFVGHRSYIAIHDKLARKFRFLILSV